MKHNLSWFVIVVISFLVVGCTSHQPIVQPAPAPVVVEKPKAFTQEGKASYYANFHQNKKTANGELYKHDLKTAAHRSLPFGTKVKVTNVANGKSVVVKVNDRGPYSKGRIIDLSKSAFTSIGSLASGVLNVAIETIE